MPQRLADIVDSVRSLIADNWNAKTVTISVAATTVAGIALVYLWKLRKSKTKAQPVLSESTIWNLHEYDRRMSTRKRELFDELKSLKDARGNKRLVILEIGCGCGWNLKYYPDGSEVICEEPNVLFKDLVYENARKHPNLKISTFLDSPAENLSAVDSESVDVVVSTIVLCSVTDVSQCLREIIRILKPGGKFFFMEHAKTPPQFAVVRLLQIIFRIPWSMRHGGCQLGRSIQDSVKQAGSSSVDVKEFEAHELMDPSPLVPGARLVRSHISGTATK